MLRDTLLALRARPRRLLLLCTLVAYAPSLASPFQFDDFGVIVHYDPVHSLAAWWGTLGLRPLLKLTYALNWSLGASPVGFHLFNLAVHLANVELTMRLYTAAAHRERRWPFAGADGGALAAGLLFALHPIQTEAVTYVSGRSSSLMTFFVLLTLLLYVAGVRARRAALWLGLAPLGFVCALLTKEAAVTLPAALLLWELCLERSRPRDWLPRQAAWWSLLLVLLAGAIIQDRYFALLYQVTGTRSLLEALRYQVQGAAHLLSRLVLVHRLCIDPGLGLVPPSPGQLVAAGALLSAVLAVSLAQVRARPLVAFGGLWFLLHAFFPYLLLPRSDVVNERHMYLAGCGLFLAAGALWAEFSVRPVVARRAWAVAGVLALVLVASTIARNRDYRSAIALWESTVRVAPANPRAHHNLGIVYEASGRTAEAREAYARALVLEPRYDSAREHLVRIQGR